MTTAGPGPLDGASEDDVRARFDAIISGGGGWTGWDTPRSEDGPEPDHQRRMARPVGLDGSTTDMHATDVHADPADQQTRVPRKVEYRHRDDIARQDEEAAEERRRRRELRRALRAQEIADYDAEKDAVAAEREADDEHFVPPEPPPLPRLRRRTVVALLLMATGALMLARPGWFQIAPDAVLVLGLMALMGGAGLLIGGLRRHSADPDDGAGWDNGARV